VRMCVCAAVSCADVVSLSGPSQAFGVYEPAWSPVWSGVLIGLLQLFAIGVGGSALGQSACYVTVSGCALSAAFGGAESLSRYAPYYARHFERWHWWQVALAIANVAGAYASATLGGVQLSAYALSTCPSPLQSFVGGFMLLFGARVAE
jgi:hypothetical protein